MGEDGSAMGDGSTCVYKTGTTTCDHNTLTRKMTAAMPCDDAAGMRSSGSEVAMQVMRVQVR